jgi:hypothetical protein
MWTLIECAGHPRDMGLAQGGAARASIRSACAAAGLSTQRSRMPTLAPLNTGTLRGVGAGRELFRHFAHQAERLEGLARAAGVPMDSILALHLRARTGGAAAGLLARRARLRAYSGDDSDGSGVPAAANSGKRVLLERSLPRSLGNETSWMLRESRPAVGFRSVELGLPWLVPGVAGVNEAGLSVMASPILGGPEGTDGAPPSLLLVQECLQRFEDLGGALDWCAKRPVEGEQSFVLADASGAVATVLSRGRERRIQEGEGELFFEVGEPASAQDSSAEEDSQQDRLLLDPLRRCLRLEAARATIEVRLDD